MTLRQAGSERIFDWTRARGNSLVAALLCAASLTAPPAEAQPIKVAIFDFELEDVSAAVPSTGDTSSDAKQQLASVTNEIRNLFAQSGRYDVVDVSSADAPAARSQTLRDCNGCDAAIAQKLGATQSFVGVVRRISRTEYTVRFEVRDTGTGTVVSAGDSGLRMGADYSWNRGAARLVKDRLLESAR